MSISLLDFFSLGQETFYFSNTFVAASAELPDFIIVTDLELQDIMLSDQQLRGGIPNRIRGILAPG